jgi:biotin operon repressor
MSTQSIGIGSNGFVLKEPTGWFAAGERFRCALLKLSDGAFKLFAWVCLEADRRTGRCGATQQQLTRILNKSRRSMGKYIAELQREGICDIHPATNQHHRTIFEIRDEFWPYHRSRSAVENQPQDDYVTEVRKIFLALGCTRAVFSRADEETALQLKAQGIPLQVVRDALLMGACRKYVSWLNGGPQQPIATLKYFESVVLEIRDTKLPQAYSD